MKSTDSRLTFMLLGFGGIAALLGGFCHRQFDRSDNGWWLAGVIAAVGVATTAIVLFVRTTGQPRQESGTAARQLRRLHRETLDWLTPLAREHFPRFKNPRLPFGEYGASAEALERFFAEVQARAGVGISASAKAPWSSLTVLAAVIAANQSRKAT